MLDTLDADALATAPAKVDEIDESFVAGHPFMGGQLRGLLRESSAESLVDRAVLFMPPTHRRSWSRGAKTFERVGHRLGLQRLAGVLLVEAGKLVYVPPRRHPEPVRELVGVLGDIAPAPVGPRATRGSRDGRCGSPRCMIHGALAGFGVGSRSAEQRRVGRVERRRRCGVNG